MIYESNGIGKEYNGYDDTLIFEGGYINGQRNDKGKEYYRYGELLFEGEYLNGVKNGKGKEYFGDGRLSFEGEYLNGKEWIGTRFDINGNIFYIFYVLSNLIHGKEKVKEYWNDKLIFEGEYLNGKRNGKGKEYWNGKLIFEGEYLNGFRWNGKGYNPIKK